MAGTWQTDAEKGSWVRLALVDEGFDPNTWNLEHEHRIYADDYANNYAIVDEIDYQYLIQWRWRIKKSRTWAGTKNPKMYLSRPGHVSLGVKTRENRNRIQSTIFLHTEVMERTGIPRPNTNQKIIVDHANGNGFDCRRKNLRWASLSFNNKNLFGSHEQVLMQEVLI